MRDLVIILSSLSIAAMGIVGIYQERRIENLERQLNRIERGYQAVIEENKQLQRINEQNLRLMAEGGWDGTISMGAGY